MISLVLALRHRAVRPAGGLSDAVGPEPLAKLAPIESEMRPPHQLRLAIAAVTDEPISGKNATENVANAVALLTTAIVKKTVSTIADDNDQFVAGIFVIVFSDYFTLVVPGNFEEASTLAMMKVLAGC